MTKKIVKMHTKLEPVVQLIKESEVATEMGAAFASFMLNPTVVWAKFVLTDDQINGNGQRIPKSEFSNLIRTGIHMPIKMAMGEINPGHDDSKPLGTMTHLKQVDAEDGSSKIVAIAALWEEERPADVRYIKQRFSEGLPVEISWEILYEDAIFTDASMDLLGTVLRAATIVGNPAYQGRTPFISVAAKKWSKAYMENLPDQAFLYKDEAGNREFPIMNDTGKVDRLKLMDVKKEVLEAELDNSVRDELLDIVENLLSRFEAGLNADEVTSAFVEDPHINLEEELDKKLEELQAELDTTKAELEQVKTDLEAQKQAVAEKEQAVAELTQKNTELETELTPLRELQASAEAAKEREEKLTNVKNKFSEAGLEKDEAYFNDNADKLISLSEETLSFMIEELKVFAEAALKTSEASEKKTKIPALRGSEENAEEVSVTDLVAYLRERKSKK